MSNILTIVKTVSALVLFYVIYDMYCDIQTLKRCSSETGGSETGSSVCDFHNVEEITFPTDIQEETPFIQLAELSEIQEEVPKKRKYKKKEKKVENVISEVLLE